MTIIDPIKILFAFIEGIVNYIILFNKLKYKNIKYN